MEHSTKSGKIQQTVSQLKKISTDTYRHKISFLLNRVVDSIFNEVLLAVDGLRQKACDQPSQELTAVILKELLLYCENAAQLSYLAKNTVESYKLLPAILRQRLLSSLNNEFKKSPANAIEFINKVKSQVIYHSETMLKEYGNSFHFSSSYSGIYNQSISLEQQWQLAIKNNNFSEIDRIQNLFHRMLKDAGLSNDFIEEFTSKKINKLLKRLLKRSIAHLHTIATYHQLQSNKDQWIDADSLRLYKADEARKESYLRKLSYKYSKKPDANIFCSGKKDRARLAEVTAMSFGLGVIAAEKGINYSGQLICTLPSEYHPMLGKQSNPNYKNKTVNDGHQALQNAFANIRAIYYHKFGTFDYFKTFHPHRSSVPHMHIITYMESREQIRLIVTQLAKKLGHENNWKIKWSDNVFETVAGISNNTDPKINGVVFELFKNHKEAVSAVRYCFKGLGDKSNFEATRIQAWCKTHSINRFSSSAAYKTLWRDLRKMPDIGSEAQKAAKSGDYAKFYRVLKMDITEALVQLPTGSSERTWVFAKKTAPENPLVVVECIKSNIQIDEKYSTKPCLINHGLATDNQCCKEKLTVIYNKQENIEATDNNLTNTSSGSVVKKSVFSTIKSGYQVLSRIADTALISPFLKFLTKLQTLFK